MPSLFVSITISSHLKSNLVDAALNEMLNDVDLERKFVHIFQSTNDDDKVRI